MKHTTEKVSEWQYAGGTLTIPIGWFVHRVDLDTKEPYLQITSEDMSQEKTLLIPKPLAYYLGTHFCGSKVMHDLIKENARRDIKHAIVTALGL